MSSLASIIDQLNASQPSERHISSSSPEKKKTDANLAHFENILETMRTRLRTLQAEVSSESGEDAEVTLDAPSVSSARRIKSIHDTERQAEQLTASLTEPEKENSVDEDTSRTPTLYDDDVYLELKNLPDIQGDEEFEFDFDADDVTDDMSSYNSTKLLDAMARLDGLSNPDRIIRDHFAAEDTNEAGLRRGKKQTVQMEDCHLTSFPFDGSTKQGLFCVFDGFGGQKCAREATTVVPRVLAAELALNGGAEKLRDLTEILPKVFAKSDEELKGHEDWGCTATVAFVWEHEDGTRFLQAANIGDSSIFLCRGGKAIMLNVEHKASSEAEHERIRASGIDIAPNASRIVGVGVARAFGAHFIKQKKLGIISEPYVSPVYELGTEDQFIVIASDGVWDVISGQEACDLIKTDSNAADMAIHLIRHAVSKRKCMDNVTVVVVCF